MEGPLGMDLMGMIAAMLPARGEFVQVHNREVHQIVVRPKQQVQATAAAAAAASAVEGLVGKPRPNAVAE